MTSTVVARAVRVDRLTREAHRLLMEAQRVREQAPSLWHPVRRRRAFRRYSRLMLGAADLVEQARRT